MNSPDLADITIEDLIKFENLELSKNRAHSLGYIHGDVPLSDKHQAYLRIREPLLARMMFREETWPQLLNANHGLPLPGSMAQSNQFLAQNMRQYGGRWPEAQFSPCIPPGHSLVYIPVLLGSAPVMQTMAPWGSSQPREVTELPDSRVPTGTNLSPLTIPSSTSGEVVEAPQMRLALRPGTSASISSTSTQPTSPPSSSPSSSSPSFHERDTPPKVADSPTRKWIEIASHARNKFEAVPVLLDHKSPLNWIPRRMLGDHGLKAVDAPCPASYSAAWRQWQGHTDAAVVFQSTQKVDIEWLVRGVKTRMAEFWVTASSELQDLVIGSPILRAYGEEAFHPSPPAVFGHTRSASRTGSAPRARKPERRLSSCAKSRYSTKKNLG